MLLSLYEISKHFKCILQEYSLPMYYNILIIIIILRQSFDIINYLEILTYYSTQQLLLNYIYIYIYIS